MQKKFAVFVILALMAGSIFAQNLPDGINMSFWGSTAFVPFELAAVENPEEEFTLKNRTHLSVGPAWGGAQSGRTAVVTFRGRSKYIGFVIECEVDDSFRLGESSFVWVKPWNEYVQLDVGAFMNNELRGYSGVSDFEYFYMVAPVNFRDAVFNRFSSVTNQEGGALLTLRPPVPGLSVYTLLKIQNSTIGAGPFGETGPVWQESLDRIQPAVSYDIRGFGTARVQYLNAPKMVIEPTQAVFRNKEELYTATFVRDHLDFYYNQFKRIEAAFKLDTISGLILDIGFKIPFPETLDEIKYTAPVVASMTAGYRINDFSLNLGLISWFGGGYSGSNVTKLTVAPRVLVDMNAMYDLGFATVGLLYGMDIFGKPQLGGINMDTVGFGTIDIGFGAFIRKSFDKGGIQAGLTYTAINVPDGSNPNRQNNILGYFRIPILLEISFF